MEFLHCGLCGRPAPIRELTALRGFRGLVCLPGLGCGRNQSALGPIRQWLADPDAYLSDDDRTDIYVDNPKPQKET